ncbi:TetR/AcrR family transcriptional regulator [Algoriphagus terrigena]|uniref:TetR/AcrR family transcriptional regulator n=1 Tax=Algoriphagus terrigena TaxID=344884 RepID=UPI00040B5868|nr:TetR/AcrR family transcriptional regulator [Algoriphagus terrigena]
MLWLEAGYELFANEGRQGIQIERLARIIQLNKSGFYHYFSDLESFCGELVKLHEEKVDQFLLAISKITKLDPDYLLLLVENASMVMFQVQLVRDKGNRSFYQASQLIDQKINSALSQIWGDFLELDADADLTLRYYTIVRDMFYVRVSFQNLDYQFLHNIAADAKKLVAQMRLHQSKFQSL